jgi:hypothetical protein
MLHYARLELLSRNKRSSFWDPFVSYEENEVLRILSLMRGHHSRNPGFRGVHHLTDLEHVLLRKIINDARKSFIELVLGACIIVLLTVVINAEVTVSHVHPSLIFASKTGACPSGAPNVTPLSG